MRRFLPVDSRAITVAVVLVAIALAVEAVAGR